MSQIEEVIQEAKGYIGEEEVQPNLSFKTPTFDRKMKAVGFYRGASWCGFFVMLVMFETYAEDPEMLRLLKKYCSPSTHQMWANFKASKEFVTGQAPKPGAIVVWQEGSGSNGHTGIVTQVTPGATTFKSVEGNSNNDGSRNGYMVVENTHQIGQPHKMNGLNILGFVYLP